MVIVVEIRFHLILIIDYLSFEGIIAEQAFQTIVGECGFANRKAAGKFGIRYIPLAVEHWSAATSEIPCRGYYIGEDGENFGSLILGMYQVILSHISYNCLSIFFLFHLPDKTLFPQ